MRRLEREARQRLDEFTGLLGRNPVEGRRVLEALLTGPLRFSPMDTPEGKRFRIEGEMGLEGLMAVEGLSLHSGVRQEASPGGSCTSGFSRMPADLLAGEPLPRLVA